MGATLCLSIGPNVGGASGCIIVNTMGIDTPASAKIFDPTHTLLSSVERNA